MDVMTCEASAETDEKISVAMVVDADELLPRAAKAQNLSAVSSPGQNVFLRKAGDTEAPAVRIGSHSRQ